VIGPDGVVRGVYVGPAEWTRPARWPLPQLLEERRPAEKPG